ncbi:MAG: hypothetical protein HW380_1127, partial [Magnetococcales bacterium]|nr:hypothetical protein [Magnetococcales bacterium]
MGSGLALRQFLFETFYCPANRSVM